MNGPVAHNSHESFHHIFTKKVIVPILWVRRGVKSSFPVENCSTIHASTNETHILEQDWVLGAEEWTMNSTLTTTAPGSVDTGKRLCFRWGSSCHVVFVVVVLLTLIATRSSAVANNDNDDSSSSGTTTACHVCRNGLAVPWPDRAVQLPPPYESIVQTCGTLDALLPVLVSDDEAPECQLLQSVGSYCGCPIPEMACQLCSQQEEGEEDQLVVVQNPDQVVDANAKFEPISADHLTMTCGLAEAYLHSIHALNASCDAYRADLLTTGGCSCAVSVDGVPQNETTTSTNNTTTPTVCPMCEDGSAMTSPERNVGHLLRGLIDLDGFVMDDSVNVTCQQVQAFLSAAGPQENYVCDSARGLLAGICGCPSQAQKPCHYCGDQVLPHPNRMVYSFQDYGFPPATCRDIRDFLGHQEVGSYICDEGMAFGFLCDCDDSVRKNFRNQIRWIPKLAGVISILGSSYILWDILLRKWWRQCSRTTGRPSSSSTTNLAVFQQLLTVISICDLSGSIGFLLSTIPMPKYNQYDELTGIEGAVGNDATCTFQGSLIQFSLTGVLYQISLSTYFLLVIYFGWSESRVRKVLYYLHIPLVVGIGMTVAGIPFYESLVWICWVAPPPFADDYWNIVLFGILPIGLAAVVSTINLLAVYLKVRKQFAAGNRWRISSQLASTRRAGRRRGRNVSSSIPTSTSPSSAFDQQQSTHTSRFTRSTHSSDTNTDSSYADHTSLRTGTTAPRPQAPRTRASLDHELFWQCILYLAAFYISWTMIVLGLIEKYQNHHGLWVLISFFAPLQGANNFLVYVRPKIGHAYRQWKLDRWKKQLEKDRREVERQARLQDDHQLPLDIASPEKSFEDGANQEAPQEAEEKIPQDSLPKPEGTPVLQSADLQIPSFADDLSL